MPELLLALLIIAALLWQAHRREKEARRQGYIAGDYAASQRAAERELRLTHHTTEDL